MDLSRRHFLKSIAGTAAAPALAALGIRAAQAAATAPLRLVFVFAPNGVHMPDWTPAAKEKLDLLPASLAPLSKLRSALNVYSGLTLDGGRSHGDGPGDHARSAASFLTGAHPFKTAGADLRAGVSVDQVAARLSSLRAPLPSLELGLEHSRLAGSCDSGYSCAYSSAISWRSASSPNSKEIVPKRAFERVFGSLDMSAEERAKQKARRARIIDSLRELTKPLSSSVASEDKRKIEDFESSLEALESRLRAPDPSEISAAALKRAGKGDEGEGGALGRKMDEMYELIRLAFLADQTRVVSLMLGNAGSNRSYPELGVRDGHHSLSHHGGDQKKQASIAKINRFMVERLARFAQRLKDSPEGDGNLLDSTIIVFGSGIGDGNRHNHDDLPILSLGGGRWLRGGRHLQFPRNTPLCGLYTKLLQLADPKIRSFGDATAPLAGL